jgi:hypothetical protein
MSGLSGQGRSRIDVVVGTSLVMAALIGLALAAGTDFGRTPRINQNLAPPRVSAVNPPEWMTAGSGATKPH